MSGTRSFWLLDIQRKLYTWSRSNPDDAWRDMWSWVTLPQNLRLAWRRVASNRGARSSGVDKVTVKHIETRIGVERFLTKTRTALRNGSYLSKRCIKASSEGIQLFETPNMLSEFSFATSQIPFVPT